MSPNQSPHARRPRRKVERTWSTPVTLADRLALLERETPNAAEKISRKQRETARAAFLRAYVAASSLGRSDDDAAEVAADAYHREFRRLARSRRAQQ